MTIMTEKCHQNQHLEKNFSVIRLGLNFLGDFVSLVKSFRYSYSQSQQAKWCQLFCNLIVALTIQSLIDACLLLFLMLL